MRAVEKVKKIIIKRKKTVSVLCVAPLFVILGITLPSLVDMLQISDTILFSWGMAAFFSWFSYYGVLAIIEYKEKKTLNS